jgi:transcriptional regulator of arginine metabolism
MPWRLLLKTLIQSGAFRTQSELQAALGERGFAVHQTSVSRELAALGVVKRGGVYHLGAEAPIAAPVHDFRVTARGCLVVVKTEPAYAAVLGQVVDDASLPGVIGTIAGEDTVFVATTGTEGARALASLLGVELVDVPLEG